jgi:hypothetical protein
MDFWRAKVNQQHPLGYHENWMINGHSGNTSSIGMEFPSLPCQWLAQLLFYYYPTSNPPPGCGLLVGSRNNP